MHTIVLSGTGADGSLGLVAVKDRGGLVIVQDPEEAEYNGMPRSAIATGAADLVLALDDVPDALATHPHPAANAQLDNSAAADPEQQWTGSDESLVAASRPGAKLLADSA